MTPPMTPPMTLPNGFAVTLRDDLITRNRRDLLLGGSPLTAMRLTEAAAAMIDGDRVVTRDAATGKLAQRLLATNLAYPDLQGLASITADDITVVIPVRDRPEQLSRALDGLVGVRRIVVDDASRNCAAIAAICARHDAELVPLVDNVGPAAARNAGLAHVRTPFVAFVDSDVRVTSGELTGLAQHFTDPQVAIVGPRVVGDPQAPTPRWFERYDAVASSLTLGHKPSNVRPGSSVGWLPSACLVARRSAIAHGFDAGLRVGEDVDLVWRTIARGHTVRYEPTITARHDTRPTMTTWLGRKIVYGSGGAELARRHGRAAMAPAILEPLQGLAALAILLRWKGSPLLAAAAIGVATVRVHKALPEAEDSHRLAAAVATRGFGWAVRQEASLAVRHWWPGVCATAVVSRKARRALATAVLVDSVGAVVRHRGHHLGAITTVAGHRLDDAAYGAGLWWGCLRARSACALIPRRPGRTSRRER